MNAGLNGYIYGISPDKHIKAIQLWQFLGCKVLFRLSMLSNGQFVCANADCIPNTLVSII